MALLYITTDQGNLQMNRYSTAYIKTGVVVAGNVEMSGNGGGDCNLFVNGEVYGDVNDKFGATSGGGTSLP